MDDGNKEQAEMIVINALRMVKTQMRYKRFFFLIFNFFFQHTSEKKRRKNDNAKFHGHFKLIIIITKIKKK